MLNDIGKFVGHYFQVWACLSIAWMVITAIFFDSLFVDFSIILLFWAAVYLIKHHPTARKWTIGICGFLLMGNIAMFIYAMIAGTEGMTVMAFGKRIESPPLWHIAAVNCVLAVLVGLPFALLLTPQARREFRQPAGA